QITELTELAQRFGQPAAQAVHVGAALHRRHEIHIALVDGRLAVRTPDDGPVYRLALALQAARERLRRQPFAALHALLQILLETCAVLPAQLLLRLLDLQHDLEPRAQHGLRAQHMLQTRDRERRAVEIRRIGPEADRRAGVALADLPDDLELASAFAVRKAHVVFLAVAADPHLEMLRQRID